MVKPWREIAVPHEDVLKGTFQQSEFAADLSRVKAGTATPEYQDPVLFFQRTFITEGMRLLLDSVVKRLSGKGGDPVIQLQTAFGGGKTHTMLAVYHLASAKVSPHDLEGVAPLLETAKVAGLPRANIVVLDGNQLSPNMPKNRDGVSVRTIWGEVAWQLGGKAAYEQVRGADESGTSPGKDVLEKLLKDYAPVAILVDELVRYIAQFEEGKSLTGGTFDSNLSFIQALTEALKGVPNGILLASLPESDREAGSQRGVKALNSLSHYFARVQALWKPVSTEEAFEIVRRRLFGEVRDGEAVESACRAYADFYAANAEDLPQETQEARYLDRMRRAYPIHPEVFDRLYEDWSSLDNFQRTRGVLKLMAKVIHRLWKDGDTDSMILPGSLPLYDADVRNEVIYYLPQGWDPVIESDVDGERAEATEIENREPLLGSVHACRRAARTIFLGSAPSTSGQTVRGVELARIVLGAVQPGQQTGRFKDAVRRLSDRLHYLNSANNRFWLDVRPNLRREMEDRKRRFLDKEHVFPAIRERAQRAFAQGVFGGTHVFTASSDVPDDWLLRLVVLPPDAGFSTTGVSTANERAGEILKSRGDQPRQRQNRLVFLAAEQDAVARLKDHTRTLLAWQSIVEDIREMRLNLDQYQARQASRALEEAGETLRRTVRETYKWILIPSQDAKPSGGLTEVRWERFQINTGSPNLTEEIEKVLKENELLIGEWAPVHLKKLLKDWFWKDEKPEVGAVEVWQKSCCYLYLPRLKDDKVLQRTISAGVESRDFFALAYGKDGELYSGFNFGRPTTVILDASLLLVEPAVAAAYAATHMGAPEPGPTPSESLPPGRGGGGVGPGPGPGRGPEPGSGGAPRKRFYGTVDLDPVHAKLDFATIVDEVLLQFTSQPNVRVKIRIDIEALSGTGFSENTQRAVKENSKVLRFGTAEFEM
jgi:predicted AAA+ superfamily ATPase